MESQRRARGAGPPSRFVLEPAGAVRRAQPARAVVAGAAGAEIGVTSNRPDVCEYGYEPYVTLLVPSAYTAPTNGAERLVPPTWNQPDWPWYLVVS